MQLVEVLSKTISSNLDKGGATKSDEFLEKFQTAFDPPHSFLENYVANGGKWKIMQYSGRPETAIM